MAMTPAPALFERFAKHLYKRHEAHLLARAPRAPASPRDRSMVEDAELRGGLEVQHRPLFFVDLRVVARQRGVCERIASELRAEGAENRLVERGTAVRHGLLASLRPPGPARRGQPAAVVPQGRVRLDRAGRGVAAALDRLRDGAVCAQRRCRSRPRRRRSCARRRDGHAARRARARLDPSRSCASRTRRCRAPSSRASRATSWPPSPRTSPRALRADRVRPQGRRGRGRGEPRAGRAHLHAAGPRPSDLWLQPARGRRSGRRDRRLRRRGAEEPVHRRRHPRLLGPVPAQRDHRGARL